MRITIYSAKYWFVTFMVCKLINAGLGLKIMLFEMLKAKPKLCFLTFSMFIMTTTFKKEWNPHFQQVFSN